jgi:hypothetical protein
MIKRQRELEIPSRVLPKRQCTGCEVRFLKRPRPDALISESMPLSGIKDPKRPRTLHGLLSPEKEVYTSQEVRAILEIMETWYKQELCFYTRKKPSYTHEMEYIS